jgi:hypothetical protein
MSHTDFREFTFQAFGRKEVWPGRSSPIEGRLAGRSYALLRSSQSRGRTMNHSTNSAHRFSSSKRNVHRFQKKSPLV